MKRVCGKRAGWEVKGKGILNRAVWGKIRYHYWGKEKHDKSRDVGLGEGKGGAGNLGFKIRSKLPTESGKRREPVWMWRRRNKWKSNFHLRGGSVY